MKRSKNNLHLATDKAGKAVIAGDRVLLVLDNGTRLCGTVKRLGPSMIFHSLNFQNLQTYVVACDDGLTRPCHAWHIKIVFRGPRTSARAA